MDYENYGGYGDDGYNGGYEAAPEPAAPREPDMNVAPEAEPTAGVEPDAPVEETTATETQAKQDGRKRRPRIPVDRILTARNLARDDRVAGVFDGLADGERELTLLLLNGLAGSHTLSRTIVEKVCDAAAALDDGRTRSVAAAIVGRDDDTRIVDAILDGRLSAPARLLVSLHDETDGRERMRLAMKADARVLRDAVHAANLLGAPDLKASGNQMNVGIDLAYAAGDVDVEPVRRLA